MSTKNAVDSGLNELLITSEGAFAIYVWVFIYKFFSTIGFQQTPTIGIIFNSWLLAIGCVIGVNIVKLIYNEIRISRNFIVLYSLCAIYWLFGSVHIRDSFVVLLAISQFYFVIKYLKRKSIQSFIVLVITTIISSLFFPFLRTEFYFIPILFFAAAIFIPNFFGEKKKNTLIVVSVLIFILLTFSFLLFGGYIDLILDVLERGQKGYLDEIAETASSSSLGVKLIIDQPILIRLILGSVYMHIYPIPFWYGFKTDTIYDLFKSLNLFFLWGTLPLVYIVMREIKKQEKVLKEIILFCISVYIILVLAIAGTSLETRHLAVFFVPLLVIAAKPNLSNTLTFGLYKRTLAKILLLVVFVHLGWIALKFIL